MRAYTNTCDGHGHAAQPPNLKTAAPTAEPTHPPAGPPTAARAQAATPTARHGAAHAPVHVRQAAAAPVHAVHELGVREHRPHGVLPHPDLLHVEERLAEPPAQQAAAAVGGARVEHPQQAALRRAAGAAQHLEVGDRRPVQPHVARFAHQRANLHMHPASTPPYPYKRHPHAARKRNSTRAALPLQGTVLGWQGGGTWSTSGLSCSAKCMR